MTGLKVDKRGRSTNKRASSRERKLEEPDGAFLQLEIKLMESPAYRALSKNGMKFLHRVFIEHIHHKRKENGRLPITQADFVAYGIHRDYVRPASTEVQALGFVVITERGQRKYGNAPGKATRYCLTMFPVFTLNDVTPRTDEWRRFQSVEDALQAVAAAEAKYQAEARKKKAEDVLNKCLDQDAGAYEPVGMEAIV